MIKHLSLAVLMSTLALSCGGSAPEHGDRTQGAESTRSSDAGALAPASGLRIATWNLEWLNRKNGTGPVKRGDDDYARLRRYVDKLNADIIAFQEVDGEQAAQRVFDPEVYTVYAAAQTNPQRTGFAYRKSLQVSVHPDYAALDVGQVRAGADISVMHEGREVRLLSVHLKSGCFDAPLDSDSKECRKLAAQLPSLEEWIDTRAEEGTAAVVLGDFNRRFFAHPNEPFWAEIDDRDPPASDLWSPTEGQRARCWGGTYPDFIDHIVLNVPATQLADRESFAQLLYDDRDRDHKEVLSDHCPLAITLSSQRTAALSATQESRSSRPAASPHHAAAADETRLKGNINSAGRKLYHAPGCPDYARTQVDEAKGERWFDSAAKAEAAGWARASNCR